MQRSFHDSLHLSVQIWIASCDLARKGAFDYAAKCQFRIPRMRCFKTLQRDKFRKLTKGKHMMLALYLTLIEYFHICSYVFQRIKGQLVPEKLWSSQMSDAPSMICRALCTGRLEGCVCQWLKGKKESCLKIHSGRVQYKHVSNEWRGNVWREIYIFRHQDARVHCTYIHITKLRFKVLKRKHQRRNTKMHVGQRVRGTQWRCRCFDVFVTS